MSKPKVCLIVRDGFGENPNNKANAAAAADLPNHRRYVAEYPVTTLECCGEAVGLPAGYQGSSEVGHMNMGAGRVVLQELKRIDDGLSTGVLFEREIWETAVANWKQSGGTLHLLGLLQDEGVHAHQEHLFKILRRARQENPAGRIVVHPFLDGRDTPPRSTLEYVVVLQKVLAEVGNAEIGTAMGRYYAMDRGQAWGLTDIAYNAIVSAEGRAAQSIEQLVEDSYANDKLPDGGDMSDEYIPASILPGYTGVSDGDVVFHTNYRQDRAIQLTRAFIDNSYPGTRKERKQITYLGLSRYFNEFEAYLLPTDGNDGTDMSNLFGEWLAAKGKKQLRIAETQKFPHVTSFFNGKNTTPSEGEDQVHIKGRFDPSLFARHPEMDAYTTTEKLLAILDEDPDKYDAIVLNYPNCDMVGHTGVFDAAKKACEVVDECVGTVVDKLLACGYEVLLTADHGNADQMENYETGRPMTSHSMNPVLCSWIGEKAKGQKLIERGKLADIAVTMLYLLDIPKPAEMTADNLIAG
ncbi:MAG: 2,3-bisphosphoglycerate-independent phosphoglycerate mutase [Planctomycetota bacterium]|jgi:2,3-bisphosphoglycerate-independent phosphoglycerate mutase|nr:2,3-bisphosphoglycerate-independent phosphoglycerate mutase [Planctomycetota bacterium]